MRSTLVTDWPALAIELSIGSVRLEPPDDVQLQTLAALACVPGGVVAAGKEHFVSWLAGNSPEEIRRRVIADIVRRRDLTARPGWRLDLAVLVEGAPVGVQSLAGFDRWPAHKNVGTSSWLATRWQRCGLGTRSRTAVLDLAFDHLNAKAAFSWADPANIASTRISQRLGYQLLGGANPHDPADEVNYRLDADAWTDHRPRTLPATHVEHLDALLPVLTE